MVGKDFKNEAFMLHGKDNATLVNYPLPGSPGPREVLLRSLSTGICGTDIHYYKDMRNGNILVREPMVLGHEASAEVVEVGSEVTHVQPGDLIAYEPSVVCHKCRYCDTKDYNLCEDIPNANPPYNGSLTYYFLHPAQFAFKVPKHVSADEAALVEPISIAVHAVRRAKVTVGSKVFITGAGTIGLLTAIVARAYGATRVVHTDINEERLALAREVGADETILVSKSDSEQDLVAKVKAAFGGKLPDRTFECSGIASNFRLVLFATESHGLSMFVGMGPVEITLPVAEAANREVDIRTCHRSFGHDCFPLAIELVASGKYPFEKLITHRFSLKDSIKALETVLAGKGLKVMIQVAPKSVN